ncbi:MAG: MBL fold metallo-hydrolase [Christensenellaceae bacterium]|nr:MBL fold metallo-hydrolase [Christensenellaceae bacterium]
MKVTFIGAAHEVTGSCTLVTAGNSTILIDCGMEQGEDIFKNAELAVDPSKIDCVLLTHAHIDHAGKIPLLYKNGFNGHVYATEATCNLCNIMLLDSAHIQEQDAEWKTKKALRQGLSPVEPMYTIDDAKLALSKFVPCSYERDINILENAVIRFTDIGHLLGSSAIQITLTENGETRKITFSGDVGNTDQPIINDPTPIKETDYLVIESTYGNRLHAKSTTGHIEKLSGFIQKVFDRGGSIIIPSFAVGRTQELLYFLRIIKLKGLVKGHDGFKVYVDSPLANEATAIFTQCDRQYFDTDLKALLDQEVNPLFFDGLNISMTADESKAINEDKDLKIVIAASGMCEAGRIRHHLKHHLWRKEDMILFVGYQAVGTLGRAIVDGAKKVKLFNESINVNAEVAVFDSISGHADKNGLLNWLNAFEKRPKTVFVNHGDDDAATEFTRTITEEYGYNAIAPYSGTVYDLIKDEPILLTDGQRLEKKKYEQKTKSLIGMLYDSIDRLMATAKRMKGAPNSEIKEFTKDVDSVNDKWSRWLNK